MALNLSHLDGANGFRLDGSGGSVAGAGDVNGDGIGDLIIGSPSVDPGGDFDAGESYVVFGSSAGFGASFDLASLDGSTGFRLEGIDEFDDSGASVSGAGDANGDGIDDLIIGAAGADPGGKIDAGESYVVFGTSAGFAASLDLAALDGSTGFRLEGIDEFDDSGASVSGAGDVNGDGVDDLIIGAPGADVGDSFYAGEGYVVFGSAAGFAASLDLAALDGANGFRLESVGDSVGMSAARAGDINGDGFDDVIIGGSGGSYAVFGSAVGFGASVDLAALDGGDGFRLYGAYSSHSVAGAGDVNGDGIDDLIVADYGASYVMFGTETSFAPSLDLSTLAGSNGFRLDVRGGPVSGAGDVNGDGIDDLLIGAPYPDPDGRNGAAAVVYGSEQLGGTNDAPSAADDALSVGAFDVVDVAGDNGAGFDHDPDLDDLTITAIDGRPVAVGDSVTLASGLRVTVLGAAEVRFDAPCAALGTSFSDSFVYEISDGRGASDTAAVSVDYIQDALALASLDGTNGFRLDGSGSAVAGAGDINGDGIDDLIVAGSYVVFGAADGFGASLDLAELDGGNGFRLHGIDIYGFDYGGSAVAGAGDVNGDGVDDLIVGAFYATADGEPRAGQSYVVFGTDTGFPASLDLSALDGSDGFRLDGSGGYDYSGTSVAGAGDVNGDGFDDVIIGAPDFPKSYVVFGTDTGFAPSLDLSALDGSNGFRIDGSDVFDAGSFGWSVAGAGDVNGDGIDDVFVGAPGADPGNKYSAGASYVVFGTDTGFAASLALSALDGSNGFRLVGIDAGDDSGFSVAGAADVNGDGFDDLIVGARGGDPDGTHDAGESYVVFGTAAGFAASLDLSMLDGSNGFRLDGIDVNDLSGWSVAGAGDVNGDGFDDLIVGGGAGPNGAGASYVVFGTDAGFAASFDLSALDGSEGFRLVGIDEGDDSGRSVAGAGDVNSDGFDDLIVGSGVGESYVIFGFATDSHGVTLNGSRRPELLEGTAGDDRIFGSGGQDTLVGRAGDDLLRGGKGQDLLKGGPGADRLVGGAGRDLVSGGAGRDVVSGGAGADRLAGGGGADTFVFAPRFGADWIRDFDADPRDGQDRLDVRALGITAGCFDDDVTITDLGNDTRVALAHFGTILLHGVLGEGGNTISASDFLLA